MSKGKIFFSVLGVIVLIAVGLQLVPYGRNHTNPPVQSATQWDSPHTREWFARACADCHSNETVWPWYSNIAPISWLVQRDVDKGREAFNISVESGKGDESAEKVASGEMPPGIYTLLHPEAKLSTSEKQELLQGLAATFGGESEKSEASQDRD